MKQINGFAGGMMGWKSWEFYEVASVLWFQVFAINDKL
jgi:hypothetical protein